MLFHCWTVFPGGNTACDVAHVIITITTAIKGDGSDLLQCIPTKAISDFLNLFVSVRPFIVSLSSSFLPGSSVPGSRISSRFVDAAEVASRNFWRKVPLLRRANQSLRVPQVLLFFSARKL